MRTGATAQTHRLLALALAVACTTASCAVHGPGTGRSFLWSAFEIAIGIFFVATAIGMLASRGDPLGQRVSLALLGMLFGPFFGVSGAVGLSTWVEYNRAVEEIRAGSRSFGEVVHAQELPLEGSWGTEHDFEFGFTKYGLFAELLEAVEDEGDEDLVRSIFSADPDKRTATAILNSGRPRLEATGTAWAQEQGYEIERRARSRTDPRF